MRVLLDTHLLLWSVGRALRLSQQAKEIILDSSVKLSFIPVSIWEVAIKNARGSPDFQVHPRRLFEDLVNGGYYEIPMRAEHALAVADLPKFTKIHSTVCWWDKRRQSPSCCLPLIEF